MVCTTRCNTRCRRLCILILLLKTVLIVIGFAQQAAFIIKFIVVASAHHIIEIIRQNPAVVPVELYIEHLIQLNLVIKQTIMVNVINAIQVIGIMVDSIVLLIGTIVIKLILIGFEIVMNLDMDVESKANMFLVCLEVILVALLIWLLLMLILDKNRSQCTYHVYNTQVKYLYASIQHCQSFTSISHIQM